MQNQDNQSYMAQDNLRLEIAILQEDIKSQDPGSAKFKVPTIMTGDDVGYNYASSKNSASARPISTGLGASPSPKRDKKPEIQSKEKHASVLRMIAFYLFVIFFSEDEKERALVFYKIFTYFFQS